MDETNNNYRARARRIGIILFLFAAFVASPAFAIVTFRSASSASAVSNQTTRFYMENNAPDVTIATPRGAWDNTGSVLQRRLSRTKAGALTSRGIAETSTANDFDVLILKFVSEPITSAQTINGTLNWVVGASESATGMNANWHVHAYVTQGDTDNVRGTLVTNYTEAAGTNEWPTTAVGDAPTGAVTVTPVAISAGDRVVIEAGYVARNTVNTSFTGTLWYGGTNATDLAAGGDETTLPGWWEFSQDLFNASPLTIPKPTGTVAADVMIASVTVNPSTVTITPPGGWALINEVVQGTATSSRLATYYRVAGTGEPASYTWTFSGGTHAGAVGGIMSFVGVDNATPIDAQAGGPTASNTTHVAPSVTTTQPNGMLVTIHELASSRTWTAPGTMTEAVDVASLAPSNAAGISMEMNYEQRITAGATGTRTATVGGNADSGGTQSVALRPTPLICFTDDFNRADGAPGPDWVVSSISGTFGSPVIVNNRLRLTNASGAVSTMANLQRLFPGAGNRIEVEFDHFAYGGNGADGIALILSSSSVNPVPGAFGGSLGYAQKSNPGSDCTVVGGCPGFAGGWLGIGIDEFGNFSNPSEGRSGGPGQRADSVSVRGSGSGMAGYAYHTGTNTLAPGIDLAGATPAPGYRYRIILDHQNSVNAFVTVERNTGAGYATIIPSYDAKAQAGQAVVPTGWLLSYTGSTGGSTNIHEVDNLQVCATSQTPLSGIHHFEITPVTTSPNTCQATSVTIVAKDINNATLTGYTGTVNIVTSTNHGDWFGTTNGTLNNGTAYPPGDDNGAATYTFAAADNGSVTLQFRNTHADDMSVIVTDPAVPSTSTTSSSMSFRNSGFLVAPSPVQTPIQVIAGRDQNYTITLTGSTCAPDINYTGAKNMDMWLTRDALDPTGVAPTINSVSLPSTAPAPNPASNNLPSITFTSGVATVTMATTDVGRYVLNVRDDTRLYATAVDLTGASPSITVGPWLRVTVAGNPAGSAATDSVFTSAGSNFSATVTGVRWQAADDLNNDGIPDAGANLADNPATPSFAWPTTLSAVAPYTPVSPGILGALSNGAIAQSGFSGGSASVTTLQYSEVGSFTMQAAAADYLNASGSGVTFSNARGIVGRFTPAYFNVAVTDGCAGPPPFTYSGQPYRVTVTAWNAAATPAITQNFDGTFGFAKNVTISDPSGATNCPLNTCFAGNTVVASNFSSGSGSSFAVTNSLTGPQPPITYTTPVRDSAPLALTSRASYTDVGPVTISSAGHTESPTEIRGGRLLIENANGSELLGLSLPIRVQYFKDNTNGFVTNAADTCTSLAVTSFTLTSANGTVTPPSAVRIKLPTFDSTATLAGSSPSMSLALTAPMGDGYADATALLGSLPWLRYDWDGNGVHDNDPVGRATFGIFRGNPRHIYRRERY